jgi:hypothetical protein
MSSLRLFVTRIIKDEWPNKVVGNDTVPDGIVTSFDYEEIIICGGEPFAFKRNLERLLQALFMLRKSTGIERKVLVETSKCDFWAIDDVIKLCDGIICTPKTKENMVWFKQLNNELLKRQNIGKFAGKTMKLNILPSTRDFFPENLRVWEVQYLPADNIETAVAGDFCRIAELWESDQGWYDLTR